MKKIYKIILILIFIIINIDISYSYDEEFTTSWNWWIKLNVWFDTVPAWKFNSTSTWVIRFGSSLDPINMKFSEEINLSYSGSETWTKFWYVFLNWWIFPAWFSTYTINQREEYLIDNICKKNTDFDFIYNSYSQDKIKFSYNNMEWTTPIQSKALIICAKTSNWKYWVYWLSYRLKKEWVIFWNAPIWFSKDEIYNNYWFLFYSSWLPSSDHDYKYYITDLNNSCSNNKNNYNQSLNYNSITDNNWETVSYINSSNWITEKKVCFWIIKDWDDLIYKEEKKIKYTSDISNPNITISNNDWTEANWYNSDRNITINCNDTNIVNCTASYWWVSYVWTQINSSNININITLDKVWDNIIHVNAIDSVWLNKTLTKSFKLDKIKPSVSIFFEEIINPATLVIEQIKTKAICIDWESWCNNNFIAWWTQTSPWTYEKTYNVNNTYSINVTDKVWNSFVQFFWIFNIWKSLANFYWSAYSALDYSEINIWAWVTQCWVPSSCDRNSPNTLCATFQANISPNILNWYDVYTEWVSLKYKANHKLYTIWVPPVWKIRCQYYDWQKPDFNIQRKSVAANVWNLSYNFAWLVENGWSWLKKIEIKWEKEDWTTWVKLINITDFTTENNYKNWAVIDLWLPNYQAISNYDFDNNWYWEVKLKIKVEDWAWNFSEKNDSIYIIPWPINLSNSIFWINQYWHTTWTDIIADWDSYYEININFKDAFWNKIKDYIIPWVESRNISSSWITFKNTTDFLNNVWNPIYYKWPWLNTFSNLSNTYNFPWTFDLTQNWWFYIGIKSLVPTDASWYPHSRWDISISNFIINDSKFGSINLWTINPYNSPLSFWPAVTASITNMPTILNDNITYNILIELRKNILNDNPIINISNLIVDFNFSNSWWLKKRILIDWVEQFSNNWTSSFIIWWCDLSSSQTCTKNITINLDSNWVWFWDSSFDFNLWYNFTTFWWLKTSYQILKHYIWTNVFKNTNIEIKWIVTKAKDSKWLEINKDWINTISLDKEWFNKSILSMNIKRNIEKYLKYVKNLAISNTHYNLNLATTLPSFINADWEKFYLYDFSWKTCNDNYNNFNPYNKWCNVKITSWGKQEINWKINIVIKWWNLILDTDMYYKTNKDIIWYFVFRDSQTKNWWNVYITQKPTNIFWILNTEWSIMSIDNINNPTKIFDKSNTNFDDINKQLLWFGSIYSINTIGWSIDYDNNTDKTLSCPYNSDIYVAKNWDMSWCTSEEATKYDLSKLRRFISIDWNAATYCDWSKFWIDWNWNKVLNSFVWKKDCYSDLWDNDLRKTNNDSSSLIIEYDSNIKNNPLLILTNN